MGDGAEYMRLEIRKAQADEVSGEADGWAGERTSCLFLSGLTERLIRRVACGLNSQCELKPKPI
eukprot:scaffold100215_cov25-Tisochrysis_lutea.AAC.1